MVSATSGGTELRRLKTYLSCTMLYFPKHCKHRKDVCLCNANVQRKTFWEIRLEYNSKMSFPGPHLPSLLQNAPPPQAARLQGLTLCVKTQLRLNKLGAIFSFRWTEFRDWKKTRIENSKSCLLTWRTWLFGSARNTE